MMNWSATASAVLAASAAFAAAAARAAGVGTGAGRVSAASCNSGVVGAKRIVALELADEVNKCRFVGGRQCLETRARRSGLTVMPCHRFGHSPCTRIVQQTAHLQRCG